MVADRQDQRNALPAGAPGAETDLDRKLTRLSILVEIAKRLSSSLDPDVFLSTVHTQIGRILDARNFYVAVCAEDGRQWSTVLSIEHGQVTDPEHRPIDAGLTGYIIRNRVSLIFRTPAELESFERRVGVAPIGERPTSWMGVPLITGDRMMGVMGIQSYDLEIGYSQDDLEFFSTVATQVATALQNARLFKDASERATRFSILLQVSRALSSHLELDALLETVFHEVGRVFDTRNFYVATYLKGSAEWVSAFHVEDGEFQPVARHPLSKGLTGFILRSGQPLLFTTLADYDRFLEAQEIPAIGLHAKSWMGVPLVAEDQVCGVLGLQNYEREEVFGQADLDLFSAIASQVAAAIRNTQLYRELSEAMQALWSEMELAKMIQTVLLPKRPGLPGYDLVASMEPAEEVGGDYYDVFSIDGCDWIVVGDVSGHGVTAGLVMMMVQTAIHTVLLSNPRTPPADLLAAINRSIYRNLKKMDEQKHMTILVMACGPRGTFRFSGLHEDLLLWRARTRTVERIQSNGMWIGIEPEIADRTPEDTLTMAIGDCMLLFTDGVTEARREGGGYFGDRQLGELMEAGGDQPVAALHARIMQALEPFQKKDDITLIILKRRE